MSSFLDENIRSAAENWYVHDREKNAPYTGFFS